MSNPNSIASDSFNLIDILTCSYLVSRMATSALSFTKSDKEGAALIAASRGSTNLKAHRASISLLPPPFDAELLLVKQAMTAIVQHRLAHTIPFGVGADGESAKGDRLFAASKEFSTAWFVTLTDLKRTLVAAHQDFLNVYEDRVAQVQQSGAIGSFIPRDFWPSYDDVANSFKVSITTLPLPTGVNPTMPLEPAVAKYISAQLRQEYLESTRFGMQSVAKDTLSLVQTMADNLKRFAAHEDGTDINLDAKGKPRSPKLYESLVGNLRHQVGILRAYALPSVEGDALRSLADRIESELTTATDPADRIADIKASAPLARAVSERASAIAEAAQEALQDILY